MIKRIREAILDEVFKPGDHLGELELAERFKVSRSPVREALLGLEKEGTVIISPYKGAIETFIRGRSPGHCRTQVGRHLAGPQTSTRHLSPVDFDHAYALAKRLTRINSAKEHFEYNSDFWDIIFSKAKRPILREVFHQQEDRSTRYEPLLLKLFPPETRPRQRELLIEIYRKGKITEAFRAFKKIYLEIVDEVIDHLKDLRHG